MWKEAQVAERMSLVSAADVGTVAVITVSGLIGPNRTSVTDTEKVRKRPSWTFGTSMTASPFVTVALREVKKIAYSDLVSQQRDPISVLSVRRVSARFGIKSLYSGSVYRFVEGLVPSNAYPPSGPCGGGAAAPRATPGGRHKG
jgi:hypothetical protein